MRDFLMPPPVRETVTAYHGTSMADARAILARGSFLPSTGAAEWLGHGVYFWTSLPLAWWWARQRASNRAAVLRVTLLLGYCLDGENMCTYQPLIDLAYARLRCDCDTARTPLPQNLGDNRQLDCAVFNLAGRLAFPQLDSIKWPFQEGDPLYEGTTLRSRAHIQVCMKPTSDIRYPELIPQEDA